MYVFEEQLLVQIVIFYRFPDLSRRSNACTVSAGLKSSPYEYSGYNSPKLQAKRSEKEQFEVDASTRVSSEAESWMSQ